VCQQVDREKLIIFCCGAGAEPARSRIILMELELEPRQDVLFLNAAFSSLKNMTNLFGQENLEYFLKFILRIIGAGAEWKPEQEPAIFTSQSRTKIDRLRNTDHYF
jgi:hypothetical protein